MPAWIIQATRVHFEDNEGNRAPTECSARRAPYTWQHVEQVPTFVLPECLGLMTEATARKVARKILGVPMDRCHTTAVPLSPHAPIGAIRED